MISRLLYSTSVMNIIIITCTCSVEANQCNLLIMCTTGSVASHMIICEIIIVLVCGIIVLSIGLCCVQLLWLLVWELQYYYPLQ